jgi:hypothetical protein
LALFIRRILSLLFSLGIYKFHYKVVYSGEVVSTNKFYASPHWSIRSKMKNKYATIFAVLLKEAKVKPMEKMSLVVFCNTRLDIDNHVMNKFLIDVVKEKYLEEDTTKFYESTHTVHDPSLPKNTIHYHLIGR